MRCSLAWWWHVIVVVVNGVARWGWAGTGDGLFSIKRDMCALYRYVYAVHRMRHEDDRN